MRKVTSWPARAVGFVTLTIAEPAPLICTARELVPAYFWAVERVTATIGAPEPTQPCVLLSKL